MLSTRLGASSSPLIAPIFRSPRNVSSITRDPWTGIFLLLLLLLLVKETAGIISLCLSSVGGFRPRFPPRRGGDGKRRQPNVSRRLSRDKGGHASARDLRRRLTSCFAWQCFDPVVIGYRSVTKQSTQQPTARCHGLKRIRARAACTFRAFVPCPHAHAPHVEKEKEEERVAMAATVFPTTLLYSALHLQSRFHR